MQTSIARRTFIAGGLALSAPSSFAAACPALLSYKLPRLQDEKPIDLCQYAGKVVLVVNTASYCGYTPQYKSLEALNERYGAKGLVVLGFPTNDFGQQEPGSNNDIADFCENTFGVKFPMFARSQVKTGAPGPVNPLFAELAKRSGSRPQWNFHKYLIGRDGEFAYTAGSSVDPMSRQFVGEVERLLGVR
jgi:glutathione peroxidase